MRQTLEPQATPLTTTPLGIPLGGPLKLTALFWIHTVAVAVLIATAAALAVSNKSVGDVARPSPASVVT